ncbi:MAG: 16S rRNA (cytidine(1402)-2'-O)-methyltransferase [Hyphomicrobiaceae bacterium]
MSDSLKVQSESHGKSVDLAVGAALRDIVSRPIKAGLYLVATPIGNLNDISLRALAVLVQADSVYCEDTRTSRKLLTRYGIRRKLNTYQEHNAERARPEILASLAGGQSVALISDAGTPVISDPGFKLVRAAIAEGYDIVPIPGPTAVSAAISAAGLASDRFLFAGFLSQRSNARRNQLRDLATVPYTLVFYESPHRLAATLADMAAEFADAREAVVARELTKKFEEFRRGRLADLAAWATATPPRGEITIVVSGCATQPSTDQVTDADIAEHLKRALECSSPAQASRQVADALGVEKSRVYDIGLKLKRGEI